MTQDMFQPKVDACGASVSAPDWQAKHLTSTAIQRGDSKVMVGIRPTMHISCYDLLRLAQCASAMSLRMYHQTGNVAMVETCIEVLETINV